MTDVTRRNAALREMLNERRRGLQDDVRSRLRDGRADRTPDVADDLEHTDADAQLGVEFSLLQMRAELLLRIDGALSRLDAGKYGLCAECEGGIAERRLRAVPFAVRCHACEERREQAQAEANRRAPQRNSSSLFAAAFTS